MTGNRLLKTMILPWLAVCLWAEANPTFDQDGWNGVQKTQSAQTLGRGRLQLSVHTRFTDDERLLANGQITRGGASEWTPYFLIADSRLNAAYGIAEYLDAAVGLPVYYEEINNSWNKARGYDLGKLMKAYHPGSPKFLLKLRVPPASNQNPWGLALMLGASTPSFSQAGDGIVPREMEFIPLRRSATDDGSRFFGTETFVTHFTAAFTADFSKLPSPWPVIWHVNGGIRKTGFQFGADRDYDDILSGSTALEVPFHRYFGLYGEFYHETRFNQAGTAAEFRTEPTTLAFAGVVNTPVGLQFQAGATFGILRGGSTPVERRDENGGTLETSRLRGSAPVSVTVGLSWSRKAADPDPDKDGILGKADRCPNEAEDKDGFEDEDGCPDPDNDADGIPDVSDQCPDKAEDMDGFQDEDGCPDPDNDADGFPDYLDKCPMQAEDKDGFEDEDGCPDPDNDADGIPDSLDKCPSEPETKNGFQDEDGCPDEVIQKGEEVVLTGVLFRSGSSELTPESIPILDSLASQLLRAPNVRLEIQGHTDNIGSAPKNKKLSQRRAEAVVAYLVVKGVPENRLQAMGYGQERPVDNNHTAKGRSQNRRVELRRLD